MVKKYALIDTDNTTAEAVQIEEGPTYQAPAVPILPESAAKGNLTPLRQTCTWRKSLGGYPTQYEETEIRCRIVPTSKTILKTDGTLTLSSAKIRCCENVLPTDRITYNSKQSLVIRVDDIVGIGGQIREREVWI